MRGLGARLHALAGAVLYLNALLVACLDEGNAWWLAKLNKERALICNCVQTDDITIVQHFSLDRLPFLEAQCDQWIGGIAASIYVPLFNGSVHATPPSEWQGRRLGDALQHIQQLFDRLVQRGCKVDMVVFSEQLPDVSDWHSYPANTLRNMALDIARTEMVLLLDADFLVAPQRFGNALHNGTDRSALTTLRNLLSTDRALVVLPAFNSLVGVDDPGAAWVLRGDKQALIKAVDDEHVAPFQAAFHRDTNYTRWAADEPYEVEFGAAGKLYKMPGEYEPYVIAERKQLPSYDERFRGYNYNKLSYFYYLHMLGFRFFVHPWAYVVHMPHEEQHRRKEQMQHSNDKYQMMAHLFMRELPDRMRKGIYQPVLAEQPFALGQRVVYQLPTNAQ